MKIVERALSAEISAIVRELRNVTPSENAVECLMDWFTAHHDLWLEDSLALHPQAEGAFFAIKQAFQAENSVVFDFPDAVDESEHIINAAEKCGYGPWY